MSNPFEDAASTATRHTRRKFERISKSQPMVPTPAEKAVREQAEQLKQFRRWKKQIREGLLSGEYAPEITGLLRLIRHVPEPDVLVRFVRNAKWLLQSNEVMRYAAMGYIDHAISRWRVRHGLAPFDDGLPGEPDTPFVVVRRLLMEGRDAVASRNSRRLGVHGRGDECGEVS